MKGKKSSALLMLLVTLVACFLALPVIPSEHPWDVDRPSGGNGGTQPPTGGGGGADGGTDTTLGDTTVNNPIGGTSRLGSPKARIDVVSRWMVRLAYEFSRFMTASKSSQSRMLRD